jgi:AcrR family transcriptional regulator
MARTRAADHQHQRDRILDLAVNAFARIGFPSASMSELALACGTSKASLYHYFASKEDLLFEALQRYTERLLHLALSIESEESLGPVRLRRLVREFLREYQHSHDHHVALLHDLKFLSAARQEPIEAKQREVVEVFARALELVRPEAMRDAQRRKPMAMALLGSINFTFAWLRSDGPLSYEEYANMVINVWERGL